MLLHPFPPRLGYYVIGVGLMLQFLGLSVDAWMHNQDSTRAAEESIVTLTSPGHAMVVIGMGLTLVGVVVGMVSFFSQATLEALRPLVPAVPMILLAIVSLGSVMFAYQVSGSSTNGNPEAAAADLNADPQTCPAGTFWHPQMGHCMTITPTSSPILGSAPTPVCPAGYFWHAQMGHCMESELATGSGPGSGVSQACPTGYFWHPDMGHCMALAESAPFAPTPTAGGWQTRRALEPVIRPG